ncbi:predicted protein [Plenodomus lingam JN3]|uniref:Predicted protein n=1 Tax=Leptosphaeria maculans (strain JN3 / isolate v23.1.3 / race Av1-4-5-6-7-8) TaxID=985895 RepID=E4ZZ12_LEPMJ|nr:predicted protein [Plenodomus lingam JN3]CBX96447.1 predicted protein [Plenodomus lingam JN3]
MSNKHHRTSTLQHRKDTDGEAAFLADPLPSLYCEVRQTFRGKAAILRAMWRDDRRYSRVGHAFSKCGWRGGIAGADQVPSRSFVKGRMIPRAELSQFRTMQVRLFLRVSTRKWSRSVQVVRAAAPWSTRGVGKRSIDFSLDDVVQKQNETTGDLTICGHKRLINCWATLRCGTQRSRPGQPLHDFRIEVWSHKLRSGVVTVLGKAQADTGRARPPGAARSSRFELLHCMAASAWELRDGWVFVSPGSRVGAAIAFTSNELSQARQIAHGGAMPMEIVWRVHTTNGHSFTGQQAMSLETQFLLVWIPTCTFSGEKCNNFGPKTPWCQHIPNREVQAVGSSRGYLPWLYRSADANLEGWLHGPLAQGHSTGNTSHIHGN